MLCEQEELAAAEGAGEGEDAELGLDLSLAKKKKKKKAKVGRPWSMHVELPQHDTAWMAGWIVATSPCVVTAITYGGGKWGGGGHPAAQQSRSCMGGGVRNLFFRHSYALV